MLLSTRKELKSLQICTSLTVFSTMLAKVSAIADEKMPKIAKISVSIARHLNAIVNYFQ